MAEALYRKYRPQVFEDVVGQEPIERTLKNAIAKDKVSHAYLFCGPRGTGKTTTARLLAKALLCQRGPTPDPDGTCEDCQLIADGVHPDVYELDAASRTGVDNVREEIISRVQFAPTRGRSKVYIIDEVHMLSVAAFNALLKTLEEPPGHVVFVLCTTDPQKVPETIHSRCQRFDFRRIAPESMVSRLGAICIAEGVEFEGEALDLIAHRAEGGLRNALTSLEQIIAFENGKVTLAGAERLLGSIDSNDMAEIVSYVGKRDIANCFRWTASYVETGADLAQFVRDMAEHVRNLYVLSLVGDDVELDISDTMRYELIQELQWFGPDRLSRLMGVLGDLSSELKTSSNPRLAFEIALTRMVRPDSDLTLEALAERVEALESGYSAVAHVVPGPVGAPVHEPAPEALFGGDSFGVAATGQPRQEAAVQVPAAHEQVQVQQNSESIAQGVPSRGAQNSGMQQGMAPQQGVAQQGGDRANYGVQQPQGVSHATPAVQSGGSVGDGAAQGAAPGELSQPRAEAAPYSAAAGRGGIAQEAVAQQTAGQDDKLAMLANPATVQRIWQAALSAVKKQKQAYGVLFMNVKVNFDTAAGALKVAFPAEATFAFNAVQKPEVQDALGAALAHAAGVPVPFRYERAGQQGATQARPQAQQAQPQVQQNRQRFSPEQLQQAQLGAQQAQQGQQAQQPQQAQANAQHLGVESRPAATHAPAPQEAEPFDAPPYDDMPPYDDGYYEQVPYEDFYDPAPSVAPTQFVPPQSQPAPSGQPASSQPLGSASAQSPAFQPPVTASAQPAEAQFANSQPDALTGVSPVEPNLTPEGGIAEDPSNVEALLQAGFGGGVVFSEVDE